MCQGRLCQQLLTVTFQPFPEGVVAFPEASAQEQHDNEHPRRVAGVGVTNTNLAGTTWDAGHLQKWFRAKNFAENFWSNSVHQCGKALKVIPGSITGVWLSQSH